MNANELCQSEFGYFFQYDEYSGECECQYGYVYDGSECVDEEEGVTTSYDSSDNFNIAEEELTDESSFGYWLLGLGGVGVGYWLSNRKKV